MTNKKPDLGKGIRALLENYGHFAEHGGHHFKQHFQHTT
jgi:hypothetical protein